MEDNLGNVYQVVSNDSFGGDFEKSARAITTEIDEDASTVIITPIVTILKEKEVHARNGVGLEPPFKLEPLEVQLK